MIHLYQLNCNRNLTCSARPALLSLEESGISFFEADFLILNQLASHPASLRSGASLWTPSPPTASSWPDLTTSTSPCRCMAAMNPINQTRMDTDVPQSHPRRYPHLLPPPAHPDHLAPQLLRHLALLRPAGHDLGHVGVYQYPGAAAECAGCRLLSGDQRSGVLCRAAGDLPGGGAVFVFLRDVRSLRPE